MTESKSAGNGFCKMELIVISRTKLKIMLSAEDMKQLDFDPCSGGDMSGRSAFKNILKEARDRCGFDAVGERVFVQYYPEKHGGCEMFVTKLARDAGVTSSPRAQSPTSARRASGREVSGNAYIVYLFLELEAVLALCARLKNGTDVRGGELFVVEENKRKYYLALGHETPLAGEYGGIRLGRGAACYIEEHGRRICSDAVTRLAEFCRGT